MSGPRDSQGKGGRSDPSRPMHYDAYIDAAHRLRAAMLSKAVRALGRAIMQLARPLRRRPAPSGLLRPRSHPQGC